VTLLLLILGALALPGPARAQPGDAGAAIIVEVNGTPITRADLDEALLMDEDFLRLQRLGSAAAAAELRRQAVERVLEGLIDEVLLADAARAARIGLTPEEEREVQRLFAERVKEGWGSVEALEEALKLRGVRIERLKARHRTGFLIRKLAYEEAGRAGFVRPEELRRYYDEHKESWRRAGRVVVSIIRVRKAGRDPEGARTMIEEAAARLEKGESMAAVAKDYPDGPKFDEGATLEMKHLDELRREWREPVKALRTGERSGVIESQDDFVIVRVEERVEESFQSFEEVQDRIYQTLEDEVRRERLEAIRARAREAAFIKRRRPERGDPRAPGSGAP
jgi:parvulin-like peptidyl-prolyl isomerase